MNKIEGEISDIQVNGALSLVKVTHNNIVMSSIVIDTPLTASYLKIGNHVRVVFKETEVIIGVGKDIQLSLQNKFEGKINEIKSDDLLSKLQINTQVGTITSIITTNAVKQLDLKVGKLVIAMVKTNEILLQHD